MAYRVEDLAPALGLCLFAAAVLTAEKDIVAALQQQAWIWHQNLSHKANQKDAVITHRYNVAESTGAAGRLQNGSRQHICRSLLSHAHGCHQFHTRRG